MSALRRARLAERSTAQRAASSVAMPQRSYGYGRLPRQDGHPVQQFQRVRSVIIIACRFSIRRQYLEILSYKWCKTNEEYDTLTLKEY